MYLCFFTENLSAQTALDQMRSIVGAPQRNIILYTFAVTLAAIVSACGESDDRPTEIGGVSGTERAAFQVLRQGNGAEPQTLDPHRAEGVPASNILRDLFEGLTSEQPNGTLVPGAAERWVVSDDGLVYTFFLRKEARWSNGDSVTAADFVYGLRRSVDPATLSQYSSILHPIENAESIIAGELPPEHLGITAVDDSTLRIQLNAPTPYFLGLLTHSTTYPMHRESVETGGERFARPSKLVGNGAYVLDEWVVQSHIKLRRNEHYWDNEQTAIEEVYYYPIENADTELKRYRADELDIAQVVPYQQLDWVRENLGDQLIVAPYLGSYYFGFNMTRPPFQNSQPLRQALNMAIDREIITQRITGAGEIPAYGWVPPIDGYTGQRPAWASWTQEQRNSEAQKLYRHAGYSPDNPLRIQVLYNTSENHKRLVVAIASMWKQLLGIETSLVNQEWKVFLETRRSMNTTQIFRGGWIGDYNDAYTFSQLMHSKNEMNHSGYKNSEYDALLDAATKEIDLARRAQLLQQAEQILLHDLPIIPIYFYVSKQLIKPWVGGFETNIMNHHYTKDLYILKH